MKTVLSVALGLLFGVGVVFAVPSQSHTPAHPLASPCCTPVPTCSGDPDDPNC